MLLTGHTIALSPPVPAAVGVSVASPLLSNNDSDVVIIQVCRGARRLTPQCEVSYFGARNRTRARRQMKTYRR